jgi:hypothetical protein
MNDFHQLGIKQSLSRKVIDKIKLLKHSGLMILVFSTCLASVVGMQYWRLSNVYSNAQTKEFYRQEHKRQNLTLSFLQNITKNSFSNLISNWTFLQFLQYFGDDDARKATGYSLNPEFLGTVVNHDPRFVDAYLFMSTPTTLYSGRPDRTVALMGKGLESLSPNVPQAYYIWLYRGTDQLLFLGDTPAARQSYLTAADWAKQENPATPESIRVATTAQGTAKFLQHNPQSKTAQISAWMMILSNTKNDQQLQQYIIAKLVSLGVKAKISETGEIKFEFPRSES